MAETITTIEAIARAAIGYAEAGWPPFPLHPIVDDRCGCIERSCTNAGKHPVTTGWPRSIASSRAAASIWRSDAVVERGIGIALGPRAGLWVLDIDPAHGGNVSLAELEAEHGELPVTWTVATGGDGSHRYWSWPDDGGEELRNAHGRLAPGVDVKASGGYVVAPPSLHVSGRRYAWTSRAGDRPAPAPAWLVELARAVRSRKLGVNATADSTGKELELRAGDRHDQLVRFCGLLRSIGFCEAAIVKCGHALLEHHAVDDDPARPIDLAHAERVMRDVARRYAVEGWR